MFKYFIIALFSAIVAANANQYEFYQSKSNGIFSLAGYPEPTKMTFSNEEGEVFTIILKTGKIEKGKAWVGFDESTKLFWENIGQNVPCKGDKL